MYVNCFKASMRPFFCILAIYKEVCISIGRYLILFLDLNCFHELNNVWKCDPLNFGPNTYRLSSS